MSTAAQVKPKPEPTNDSVGRGGTAPEPEDDNRDDEDDTPTINDVESLKKGIIKTFQNKASVPYTIFLVGETGVGKSSVLELIVNVLFGKIIDPTQFDFNIINRQNEEGGSSKQSQTNAACLYELTSNNGTVVRILDTPGLADTRGIQQDELHKRSIANLIQMHVDSVTAILILANGTVPRITVGTDYVLSTLSAIFPKTLADNIAFMFTNVSSRLSWNVSDDTIPSTLKRAPKYLLDNPIALQKKFIDLNFKGVPNAKKEKAKMSKAIKASEQTALETLVELFDWLDGLQPQPTTGIVSLYEKSQTIEANITNTLAQMAQAADKKAEIDKLVVKLEKNSADMDAFSNFEKTVNTPVWRQLPATTNNLVCRQAECYTTCRIDYKPNILKSLWGLVGWKKCDSCGHNFQDHHHGLVEWQEIIDQRVSVDQDMKKRWAVAKDGKEKTAALIEASEGVLQRLNQIIDAAITNLTQQADDYAGLSLSGSFSAQVEKAVGLLEQSYKGMQEKGVSQDQLQKVKESLDHMKQKLELLKNGARSKAALGSISRCTSSDFTVVLLTDLDRVGYSGGVLA